MSELESSRLGWTGAEPILDRNQMLADQEKYLKRILLHIYDIAISEAKREEVEGKRYLDLQMRRRPHSVFLIDGARGSGKTTLLLTIQEYLRYLGRPKKWNNESIDPRLELLRGYADEVNHALAPQMEPMKTRFSGRHPIGMDVQRQTSWYLPVLFPSDLEFGQSIMEGLLALVANTLTREIDRASEASSEENKNRSRQADALRDEIYNKVAAGWFLSKNLGTEAILNDSLNYTDFLSKRGQANVASFSRVVTWRAFVNKYLNFFNSELLVVFFDDTDVATSVSRDILHTMRIFLDHPRIVTVIAGNLHAIRKSLLLDEVKSLSPPLGMLTNETESAAEDWSRSLRQEIEESLEKVLPRRYRFYIATAQDRSGDSSGQRMIGRGSAGAVGATGAVAAGRMDGARQSARRGSEQDSDFRRVFHLSFDELCQRMIDYGREPYLIMRQKAHFRWLEDKQEICRENEANDLESFVSWWIFRNWYPERLRPRTVRHLAALRAHTVPNVPGMPPSSLSVDNLRSEHKKRLAVILYESPENFEIIHRLGDADQRVLSWLHRQTIESSWRGDRYISINGRRIYESTYSYPFVFFRLDLGIAMPVQENPDESLPRGLLPVPDGPNLMDHQPFFPRNRRQRTYGVAAAVSHTAVPANCIYLYDADCLPDAAWAPPQNQQAPSWERRLLYNWRDLFFFDLEELRSRTEELREDTASATDSRSATGAKPDVHASPRSTKRPLRKEILDPRNPAIDEQWVSDYFIHTVIPLASMRLGNFARRSAEFSDRTKPISEVATMSLLHAELSSEGRGFFAQITVEVEGLMRKYDYLDEIASGPAGKAVVPLAGEVLSQWSDIVLDKIFPPTLESETALDNSDSDLASQVKMLVRLLRSRQVTQGKSAAPGKKEVATKDLMSLATHLESYRWLVNDSRRAWLAARIFLNQISGTLKKFSPNENITIDSVNDGAPEVTRKDRFFRGDRFTIGTRRALKRWLTRSPSLKEFLNDYVVVSLDKLGIIDTEGNFLEIDKNHFETQIIDDFKYLVRAKKVRPINDDGNHMVLNAEQLRALLEVRASDEEERHSRNFFHFDPLDGASETDDPQRVLRSVTYTRLGHSFFLFLFGFAPTLPSLIHLEVAAVLSNHSLGDCKKTKLTAVLTDWKEQIIKFVAFVHDYRRIHELVKFRADVMELWRIAYGDDADKSLDALGIIGGFKPKTFGVWTSLTPDISYGSLGVLGIRLFSSLTFGENLDRLNSHFLHKKKNWAETEDNDGRVVWRSQFEDTLDHLVEALNFIKTIEFVLTHPRDANDSDAKP